MTIINSSWVSRILFWPTTIVDCGNRHTLLHTENKLILLTCIHFIPNGCIFLKLNARTFLITVKNSRSFNKSIVAGSLKAFSDSNSITLNLTLQGIKTLSSK